MQGLHEGEIDLLALGIIELDMACVLRGYVPPPEPEPEPEPVVITPIIKTETVVKWREKPASPLANVILVICILLGIISIICACLLCKMSRDKKRELALVNAMVPIKMDSQEAYAQCEIDTRKPNELEVWRIKPDLDKIIPSLSQRKLVEESVVIDSQREIEEPEQESDKEDDDDEVLQTREEFTKNHERDCKMLESVEVKEIQMLNIFKNEYEDVVVERDDTMATIVKAHKSDKRDLKLDLEDMINLTNAKPQPIATFDTVKKSVSELQVEAHNLSDGEQNHDAEVEYTGQFTIDLNKERQKIMIEEEAAVNK